MVHDVDYSLCGDDKKCKNVADKKMIKALDSIPWKERQWEHAGVRNAIALKQKFGLGVKKKLEKAPSNQGEFKRSLRQS